MKDYSNCVIITVNPNLLKPALREIKLISPDATVVEDLGNGIYIVRVNEIPVTFLELFSRRNPIFVKHIMPICRYTELAIERKSAIDAVVRTCLDLVDLKAGDEFSVQSRLIDMGDVYTAKDIEVAIGARFENSGAIPRFSDTDVSANDNLRVISVLIRNTDCFVGYSSVDLNLNEHCDEFRVFSRKPRVICRAEYKLLEAIRKFHLVPCGQFAIDLGAAPGGWTYILASKGFQVVSIDPGLLAEKVIRLAGVTHKRIRAEAFAPDREFDLLTNDMNLSPKNSCAIMLNMADHLRENALGIMTIKLDTFQPEPLISHATSMLSNRFELLSIKSLFHNRQEVTALLRRIPRSSLVG